jgi:hypothetical protein
LTRVNYARVFAAGARAGAVAREMRRQLTAVKVGRQRLAHTAYLRNGVRAMVTDYQTEESLPELFRELRPTPDETSRFPDGLRWSIRTELPPGVGVVWFAGMLISAP